MSITSSTFTQHPQPDGRQRVTELHTDHLGVIHARTYLAEGAFDVQGHLAESASLVAESLAEREFARNLRRILDGMTTGLTTQHLTVTQLRTRLRQFYQQATREQVVALATFFLTLTDVQLQNLFSITGAQLPALKNRLQARADTWAALQTATGE